MKLLLKPDKLASIRVEFDVRDGKLETPEREEDDGGRELLNTLEFN